MVPQRVGARLRCVASAVLPAHQRVLDAAARKAVDLHIVTFDASTHTAEDAARAVGVEVARIVKSLVFVTVTEQGPEPVICLISGANRVDVARLAAVVGQPGLRRATAREAHDLTGFPIGGIPPFGHLRPTRVIMDPDLTSFPTVWAAAGTSESVFEVPPAALRSLANATVAPVTEDQAAERAALLPGQAGLAATGVLRPGATSEA